MTDAAVTPGERRFDEGGPTLANLGERRLLDALIEIARATATGLELSGGDDAALWRPGQGLDVALSQDAMVEDRDFRRAWISPRQLGARALTAALSDLAGTGAAPAWCLASLCAPARTCVEDVLEIQRGLCATASATGCAVAGGDVSETDGPLVIDLSVGGTVRPGADLRRNRGAPGDVLLVTGVLGRAAAGLRLLRGERGPAGELRRRWISAQLEPVARVGEGLRLVELGVRCGGDISDGLLADAARLARSSGCAAEIWLDALPVDPELPAAFGAAWTDVAVGGGEEYELLVAVPGADVAAILRAWPSAPAPLTRVGALRAGTGVTLLDREGGSTRPLPHVAAGHFSP